MSQFPSSEFWDFSLAVYGGDGVAPACLALQDRHGVDVNLLLYCCWIGCREPAPAGPARIKALEDAVEGWHDTVVRRLRAVRKRLKTPIAAEDRDLALSLRQRIQKIEIDAEHIEQLMLESADSGEEAPPESTESLDHNAVRNMSDYLANRGIVPDSQDEQALRTVADAAIRAYSP